MKKKNHRLIVGALLFSLIGVAVASGQGDKTATAKPCHQHPQLIGRCFTMHGRLSVYNGAPSLRIWKVGTRRILGVSEQHFAMAGFSNVPEKIRNELNQDVELFGDYTVCPFTRARPGVMQFVCIDHVTNLSVVRKATNNE